MLQLLGPTSEVILRVQERTGDPYWSGAVEGAIRATGLISVAQCTADELLAGEPTIVLRDTPLDGETFARVLRGPAMFEPPLHPSAQELLGVRPRIRTAASLEITALPRQARPNIVEYPRLTAPGDGTDRRWAHHDVTIYDFAWPAVASLMGRADAEDAVSLAQARDSVLLLTVPVFDVIGRWLAYPPLEDRTHRGVASQASAVQVLAPLLDELVTRGRSTVRPEVFADPYPPGYSSALLLRHDYDRPVADAAWAELLAFYETAGVRASVGFLPSLLPREQIAQLLDGGHEAQLHAEARNAQQFREHRARLEAVTGRITEGFTVHGGPSGPGFVGDRQFGWAESAGLLYGETAGPRGGLVAPTVRIADELPYASDLLVLPEHHSLDASTRPEDHRLELLAERLPPRLARGEIVVLMNHPDVHSAQLIELVTKLVADDVWRPTMADLARHRRLTRLRAHVSYASGVPSVTMLDPLPCDVTFRIPSAHDGPRSLTIPAGHTGATLSPTAGKL
jgi:hypothetical protein